jgi:micrococcal nuclease
VVFDLPVKLTKRTASVARNTKASVTIKTKPGAECGIDVQYKSGSSTAAGLQPKIANSKGAITWKWLVGRETSKGRAPIVITCTLGDLSGRLDTSVKVT